MVLDNNPAYRSTSQNGAVLALSVNLVYGTNSCIFYFRGFLWMAGKGPFPRHRISPSSHSCGVVLPVVSRFHTII
jgi:hypothetical protein